MKIFEDERENKKLLHHDIKKRFLLFLLKNLSFFILIFANYIYFLSLERCELDSESECYKIFFPKVGKLLFTCILSCFLFSINYILPLIHKTKKNLFAFILTFISQLILFVSDDGTNFQSHGGYNRILLVIMTMLFIIFELMIITIIIFYRNMSKFYSISFIVVVFLYLILVIYPKFSNSCENWKKGLKNSELNNEFNCKLVTPQTCWLGIFDGMFDFSKIAGIDCKINIDSANVEKFYKNAKVIAFPETQLFNFTQRSYRYLQKNVLENMIDISNLSRNEQMDYEVVLNRTDLNRPEVIINLDKEYTLIGTKEKMINSLDETLKPIVDNVLVIFIDAVSRTQFKKKLPLVYEWIEKFYFKESDNIINDSNQNFNDNQQINSKLKSFQFFKYNAPIPNTQLSLGPILTGTHPNKRDVVNKLIYNQFKEKGFITAHSVDFCTSIPFYYEHNDTNIFHWENFDYEFFSIFCDPNFTVFGKELGITQGPYSVFRRCLYGKDAFEYVLEFGDKFWNIYNEEKKFLQLSFIDAHEFTLEAIKYLDKPLREFLDKNEKSFLEKKNSYNFFK